MYYPNRKKINDWVNDKTRPKKLFKRNQEYLIAFKECHEDLTRMSVITYFLMTYINRESGNTMFNSVKKQRDLVRLMLDQLKVYGVEEKWGKTFEYDINSIHRRCDYLRKIVDENIRMSEYYPFFQEVGNDVLQQLSVRRGKLSEDLSVYEEKLISSANEYNKKNAKKIKSYMDSIAEEKEAMDNWRAKNKQAVKDEKKARRDKVVAERNEIKEMKKNYEEHRKQNKKIERSFAYLYK